MISKDAALFYGKSIAAYKRYKNKIMKQQYTPLLQVAKSLELLDFDFEDEAKHEATVLNCFLSLVVLPYESWKRKKGKKIWNVPLEDIYKAIGAKPELFAPIDDTENEIKIANRTAYSFMRKLRNSIAHQNVCFYADSFTLESFSYLNCPLSAADESLLKKNGVFETSKGYIDFKFTLSLEQASLLARFIGLKFLSNIENEHE